MLSQSPFSSRVASRSAASSKTRNVSFIRFIRYDALFQCSDALNLPFTNQERSDLQPTLASDHALSILPRKQASYVSAISATGPSCEAKFRRGRVPAFDADTNRKSIKWYNVRMTTHTYSTRALYQILFEYVETDPVFQKEKKHEGINTVDGVFE
jgi:hypothetical protein